MGLSAHCLCKRVDNYSRLDKTRYENWPSKNSNFVNVTACSKRTVRNRLRRNCYQLRQIKKVAKSVKTSGKVLNLTNVEISDAAIVVLSYGEGFVPASSKFDSISIREELQKSIVKVNNLACRLESQKHKIQDIESPNCIVQPRLRDL